MSQLVRPLVLLAALAIAAPAPAPAAVIEVDVRSDNAVGPVACSLRDALSAANDDVQRGGCEAGDGADVITFADGLDGTIELESPLPTIEAPVAIRGPGADVLAVSGQGLHQVLRVENAGTVVIEGLTLRDGSASRGGCLQARGFGAPTFVTLRECRITGCGAFNGAGVANDEAVMRVERCLVDGNATTGNSGGGITNSGGWLEVVNSTISGNEATGADRVGGGIATFASEGDGPGETRIHSSTLADNGAAEGGNLYVAPGATARITHVVLAEPRSGGNCSGTVASDGFNLADDASCALAGEGDLEDDAELGALADHGGPTAVHLPAPTSPVVDAGRTSCLDVDGTGLVVEQRGTPRRADGNGDGAFECDIGAVEALPEPAGAAAALAALGALAVGARRRRRIVTMDAPPTEVRCTSRSATR